MGLTVMFKSLSILTKGNQMKIQKRTGTDEEFNPQKTQKAIVRAGAKPETAEKITNLIKPHQGMTTQEVRKNVVSELQKQEPNVAKKYSEFKK
jgi:hypothetical protein